MSFFNQKSIFQWFFPNLFPSGASLPPSKLKPRTVPLFSTVTTTMSPVLMMLSSPNTQMLIVFCHHKWSLWDSRAPHSLVFPLRHPFQKCSGGESDSRERNQSNIAFRTKKTHLLRGCVRGVVSRQHQHQLRPRGLHIQFQTINLFLKKMCAMFITLMAATASLWPIPLVDLPLIDMTLSPFLARPSTEAGEEGRTRCTWID